MSVNKTILLGNVGNDPKINKTQDGKKIATFSLKKKFNGIILLYFPKVLLELLKNMLKKVANFLLKDLCRQENGQETTGKKNIQLKLFFKVLTISLKSLITAKKARTTQVKIMKAVLMVSQVGILILMPIFHFKII